VTPLQSPSLPAEKWHIFNRNVIDTKRIPILVVFGGDVDRGVVGLGIV